jgi:3-oxoadipate enol-lactonase
MLAATPAEGYAACCEAIGGMDLRADLAGITAPTLVIAGTDDPATPPEHLAEIARRVPGARLEVIDRAAHLANVEHPETVNRLLLEHFTEE